MTVITDADQLVVSSEFEFVTCSAMSQEHLRSVVRIEQQVYPEPWTESLFLSELAQKASRDYLVAEIDSSVVGYAGLSYVDDEAHLTNIAVDPQFQGRSIATQLMLRCVETCQARGIRSMTLEVRVSNVVAQALYRKFGFGPSGVRKNYYARPREDALIMWVHDIDQPDYADRTQRVASALREVK
jgi:ribosomal-protein-alanine N-acetyltransferase